MLLPVARFAPVGLAELTDRGIITAANETLVSWLGLDHEAVIGQELFTFIADGENRLKSALQSDEWDGTPFTLSVELQTEGRPRPLLVASSSYVVDGEQRMSVAFFDATVAAGIINQTTTDRDLERRVSARLQVLVETAASFGRSNSEIELAEKLVDAVKAATGADNVAAYLLGDDDSYLWISGTNPLMDHYPADAPKIATEAIRTGEPVLFASPDEASDFAPGWALDEAFRAGGVEAVIVSPIVDHSPIGAVTAFFSSPLPTDDQILPLCGALARQAAQVFARLRLEEDARRAANRDQVTGLANRRLLEERSSSLASSRDNMLAALFLDLDEFKRVNDESGHAVGDHLLEQVGRRVSAIIRGEDAVARYGGDEFVAICSVPDEQTALTIAERVRAAIAQPYEGILADVPVRASIGVAVAPTPTSVESLIRAADVAMYEAKSAGGNSVRQGVLA